MLRMIFVLIFSFIFQSTFCEECEVITPSNADDLTLVAEFTTHTSTYRNIINSDADMMIRSGGNIAEIWSFDNFDEPLSTLELEEGVEYVWRADFSATGKYAVLDTEQHIYIWDSKTMDYTMPITDDLWYSTISPNRDILAYSSKSGLVVIWNIAEAQEMFRIPLPEVGSLSFSPDGNTLAFGSSKGKVGLIELNFDSMDFSIKDIRGELDDLVTDLNFINGELLTFSVIDNARRFQFYSNLLLEQEVKYKYPHTASFYFDENIMATDISGIGDSFILWDGESGEEIISFEHISGLVGDVNSEATLLALGAGDRIQVIDFGSKDILFEWKCDGCRVIFSPNDQFLITSNRQAEVQILGVKND